MYTHNELEEASTHKSAKTHVGNLPHRTALLYNRTHRTSCSN